MSGKLRLNGATSGYSELQAPDVAGDQTFTLPATGGELAAKSGGGVVVGYQNGDWTPISGGGLNHSNTSWSRIGNTVTVTANVTGQSTDTGSTNVAITGLPYSPIINQCVGNCMVQQISVTATAVYMNAGTSELYFYSSSTSSWPAVQYGQFTKANSNIYYTATYQTDDITWAPINGATIS